MKRGASSIAPDGSPAANGAVRRDVVPGRSLTLALGTKVQFGRTEGKIRM